MSTQPAPSSFAPVTWLSNQPYILLSLTSLFWAMNIVLARSIAGQVPPMTLTTLRWTGAVLVMLPFALKPLRDDWRVLCKHWRIMVLLSLTGFAINNVLAYTGLQFTQAINALLIQSSGPLFVALWSLILFGVRLTLAQLIGIVTSIIGVLIIILNGDLHGLLSIKFNIGDLCVAGALLVFGLYSAMMPRRPKTHPMSLIVFTAGLAAVMLLPLAAAEIATGARFDLDTRTLLTLIFLTTLPSAGAYVFFNRGVALIGPNRAAPFLHLMPVFGSVLAIVFLGETIEPFHIFGYALVLVGVFTASRK